MKVLDDIDWFIVFMLGVGLSVIVGVVLVIGITLTGSYHYEYRCVGTNPEKRLVVGVPLGGWEPIEGDTLGRCRR